MRSARAADEPCAEELMLKIQRESGRAIVDVQTEDEGAATGEVENNTCKKRLLEEFGIRD